MAAVREMGVLRNFSEKTQHQRTTAVSVPSLEQAPPVGRRRVKQERETGATVESKETSRTTSFRL